MFFDFFKKGKIFDFFILFYNSNRCLSYMWEMGPVSGSRDLRGGGPSESHFLHVSTLKIHKNLILHPNLAI